MANPESHEFHEYVSLQEFQNTINRQHEGELRANLTKLENKIRQKYPGLLSHLYKNKQYINYQSNANIGYEELEASHLSKFDPNLPDQGKQINQKINGTSQAGIQIVSKFGMKYQVFDQLQCNKVYIGFDLPSSINYLGMGKDKGKSMKVTIDPNNNDDLIKQLIASKTLLDHYQSSKNPQGISTNPFIIYHPKKDNPKKKEVTIA